MTCGIYKITNIINGKIYIGCSKDIARRWRAHIKGRNDRKHLVHHAIIKYGIEQFTFEILIQCPNICFDYWEKYYIEKYNCMVPNGYNLSGGGRYNVIVSDETRKRLSESQKGKVISDETKLKISENSKKLKHSNEAKRKMSESHKGKVHPKMSSPMEKNPKAVKVEYNGKIYGCKKELYIELGISKSTFRKRFAQGLYGVEIKDNSD